MKKILMKALVVLIGAVLITCGFIVIPEAMPRVSAESVDVELGPDYYIPDDLSKIYVYSSVSSGKNTELQESWSKINDKQYKIVLKVNGSQLDYQIIDIIDGSVYGSESSQARRSGARLIAPVTQGKSWEGKIVEIAKQYGYLGTTSYTSTFVAMESFDFAGKTYPAAHIHSIHKGIDNANNSENDYWFVKGLGLVKQVSVASGQGSMEEQNWTLLLTEIRDINDTSNTTTSISSGGTSSDSASTDFTTGGIDSTETGTDSISSSSSFTGYTTLKTSKATYTGQVVNGIPEGQGTLTLNSGGVYSGEWKNGYLPKGTLTLTNGIRYEGEFKKGKPNGFGTFYDTKGNNYSGEWINGAPNGQGTLTLNNGAKLTGEWKNWDLARGTLSFKGNRYEGEFKKLLPNGTGTFYYANGTKQSGMWENGKFVGSASGGSNSGSSSNQTSGSSGSTGDTGSTGINAAFTVGSANYSLNGRTFAMDVKPYVKDGRTFLPIAYVASAIGVPSSGIVWESSIRTVTLTKNGIVVRLEVGNSIMLVNGQSRRMDAAPEINNSRVMLPAALVANAFGVSTSWDASTSSMILSK